LFCQIVVQFILFFSSLPEITAANYNDVFNKFTEVVKVTINKHAPVKKLSRKERKFIQKP